VFPHFVDGGGYVTEFILISRGQESITNLLLLDDYGLTVE
jgi:hypothetical protein